MSFEETRLELAVKIVVRTNPLAEDLHERMRTAYDAVSALAAQAASAKRTEAWADNLLDRAWDLTRAAHPTGTPLERLLTTFTSSHATLATMPAARALRKKPRRDAKG